MNLLRRIGENRPFVVMTLLVLLSLASLVTGTEANIIHAGVTRAVSITAYPFLKAKAMAGGGVQQAFDFVFGNLALQEENELLKQRLIRMRVAMAAFGELREENARLRTTLDFARHEPALTLRPVEVIESIRGMLTIDHGAVQGIQPGMGVLSEKGVVGIVTEANDLTAKVATLHHVDCRIGAMVQRGRTRAYDGVVRASGTDWRFICTMDFIDMKDEVRVGDSVVSSPESLLPAGYPIGQVSAPPHGSGSLWKWAEVKPAVDPYRLDEVMVVFRAATSAEELKGHVPEGPAARASSVAPAMPDDRPIQERYAP